MKLQWPNIYFKPRAISSVYGSFLSHPRDLKGHTWAIPTRPLQHRIDIQDLTWLPFPRLPQTVVKKAKKEHFSARKWHEYEEYILQYISIESVYYGFSADCTLVRCARIDDLTSFSETTVNSGQKCQNKNIFQLENDRNTFCSTLEELFFLRALSPGVNLNLNSQPAHSWAKIKLTGQEGSRSLFCKKLNNFANQTNQRVIR